MLAAVKICKYFVPYLIMFNFVKENGKMDHQSKRNYEGITELATQRLYHLSGTFYCQTKLLCIERIDTE